MTLKKRKTKGRRAREGEETLADAVERDGVSRKGRPGRLRRRAFPAFVRDRKLELSIHASAFVEVDGEELAELGGRAWLSTPRPSPGFARQFAEVMMPLLSSMLPGVDVSPPGEHHPKCPNKPKEAPAPASPFPPPDFGGVGDPEFCSVSRRIDSQEVGEHPYAAPELLLPCVHLVGHLGPHLFESWELRRKVGAEIFGRAGHGKRPKA